jgi:hypothetical protein
MNLTQDVVLARWAPACHHLCTAGSSMYVNLCDICKGNITVWVGGVSTGGSECACMGAECAVSAHSRDAPAAWSAGIRTCVWHC